MRLAPEPPKIGKLDGFTEANDLFGYREFGSQLANLVQAIEGPATIILDGSWGTGKTVFTQQWAGLLRQRTVPVIQIDAFELDYHEDPFTAIVGGLLAEAGKLLPKNNKTLTAIAKSAKKLGRRFVPLAANIVVRATTSGLIDAKGAKEVGKAISVFKDGLSDFSTDLLEERFDQAKTGRSEIDEFSAKLTSLRKALAKAIAEAGSVKPGYESSVPLVIIVDELDRCRPSFALGFLERIKHFFSMDGIVFVLVTHLPQLEAAVVANYGAVNPSEYLEKFCHLRAALPRAPKPHHSKESVYIQHLWNRLGLQSDDVHYDSELQDWLESFAKQFQLSLRAIERLITHIAFVINATTKNTLRIGSLVATLSLMKNMRPRLYAKAEIGTLTWEEAVEFLDFGRNEKARKSILPDILKYALLPKLPEEDWVEQFDSVEFRYGIRREGIVPALCSSINSFSPGSGSELRT